MINYYVEGGRLLKSVGKTTIVAKKDRPYPKDKGVLGFAGSMKYTETSREDVHFHGILHIYDSERYLKLKFTDGILANVEDATISMKWNEPVKKTRKAKAKK